MSIEENIIDWIASRTGTRSSREFYQRTETALSTLPKVTGHENLESLWNELNQEGKSSDAWMLSLGHCLNHTSTFLLPDNQYDILSQRPLARLLKRNEGSKKIQLWCAAAGKGYEALGMAMFLQSQIPHPERWTIEILVTDLYPENIQFAETKSFTPEDLPADFPELWQESFLETTETGFSFQSQSNVHFKFQVLNLADNLSTIPICDIVLIRNVLPDLNEDVQLHLGTQLLNHLHPDSIVVLDLESTAPGEKGLLKSIAPESGLFGLNRKVLPPEIFNRYEVDESSGERFELDSNPENPEGEMKKRGYRKLAMSPEDYAWLIRYVRRLKLFESIPESIIGEICKRIELFEFDLGVAMIHAGQQGEAFFIIYKGEVDVWNQTSILKKPIHSANLKPGDVFGEMSIILDAPANATVKGTDVTQVFALSRALFEYLLEKNRNFKNHLGNMVAERALDAGVKRSLEKSGLKLPELNVDFSVLRNLFGGHKDEPQDHVEEEAFESEPVDPAVEEATRRDYLELLKISKDIPIFNDAPLQEVQPEPGQVLLYEFPSNYKVIKEGKKPDAVYLVADGYVRVSTGGKLFKKEIPLAILGRGQLVGEISLLRGGPSIAQVMTEGEVRAFRIDRKLFGAWCETSDAFRQNVEEIIDEREPPSSD